VEESRRDEITRREKSGKEVEIARDVGKEKRRKYAESNGREKVFCL